MQCWISSLWLVQMKWHFYGFLVFSYVEIEWKVNHILIFRKNEVNNLPLKVVGLNCAVLQTFSLLSNSVVLTHPRNSKEGFQKLKFYPKLFSEVMQKPEEQLKFDVSFSKRHTVAHSHKLFGISPGTQKITSKLKRAPLQNILTLLTLYVFPTTFHIPAAYTAGSCHSASLGVLWFDSHDS